MARRGHALGPAEVTVTHLRIYSSLQTTNCLTFYFRLDALHTPKLIS